MLTRPLEDYPLIKQLRYYGLDNLVPQYAVSDDDDSEGIGHTHVLEGEVEFDPLEEDYYEGYDYGDDALNDFFDEEAQREAQRHEFAMTTTGNLDDLVRLFDDDSLEPEQLLSKNLWDLFGITKKQMDMIPWDYVKEDFDTFYDNFRHERRNLPIEKKIKYAVACTMTGYRPLPITTFPPHAFLKFVELGIKISTPAVIAYLERLIDTHSLEEFAELYKLYDDYFYFLADGLEMNQRRAQNGDPVFKYDMFPKASHLKDLHDKAYRDYETLQNEREAKERRALNKEIKRVINGRDYQQYLFTSDKYAVIAVKNQQDLDREGKMLEHCVASYGSRLAAGTSFIYFIRKTDNINKPFFTAEIVPGDPYERTKARLTQCYTYNDTIDKTDSLRNFIREWADKCHFQISCEI